MRRWTAIAVFLLLLVGGSGAGSNAGTARWTWPVAVPGDLRAEARELAAAEGLTLVAAERDGTLLVGPLVHGDAQLEPLEEAADGGPLVVYTATGDADELVGVARGDVDRVEATLADGRLQELPLNEWRGFSYRAEADGTAATSVVAYAAGGSVGAIRLPHATGSGSGQTGYTISNRGRRLPARQTQDRLFEGFSYRLFLLGQIGGRAFYRIEVTPRYTCWGAGKASRIGEIGVMGCPNLVGAYPLQLEGTVAQGRPGRNQEIEYLRIDGIAVDQAAAVALVDRDGEQIATTPVVDNLYSFQAPYPNTHVRVVALDAQGRQLKARPEWGEKQTPPPNLFGPHATRIHQPQLQGPIQQGEAKSVRVRVGSNGVVVFDDLGVQPGTRKLLRGRLGLNCFKLSPTIRHTRAGGISAEWEPRIAFRVLGIKAPFDGCQIQGTYGHRWRDQYGPHSAVEIAFNASAERYFEHRAAARDLALFVRSGKMQRIRKQTGAALLAALGREYGDAVVVLDSETAAAPARRVGVWVSGSRTVFSERSTAGGRFFVELRNGKIAKENVRGLAFVF